MERKEQSDSVEEGEEEAGMDEWSGLADRAGTMRGGREQDAAADGNGRASAEALVGER